jgi:hypothetical protein
LTFEGLLLLGNAIAQITKAAYTDDEAIRILRIP